MQRVLSYGFLNKWKLRKVLNFCELRFDQQGYIAKNGNFITNQAVPLLCSCHLYMYPSTKSSDVPIARLFSHPQTQVPLRGFFWGWQKYNHSDCKDTFWLLPQKNSMKFNSQWNFGRKMHMWPAASIISCMRGFCFLKSSSKPRSCFAQQEVASIEHLGFKHSRCMPTFQRSLSLSTCLIPFRALGNFRWSDGKILG